MANIRPKHLSCKFFKKEGENVQKAMYGTYKNCYGYCLADNDTIIEFCNRECTNGLYEEDSSKVRYRFSKEDGSIEKYLVKNSDSDGHKTENEAKKAYEKERSAAQKKAFDFMKKLDELEEQYGASIDYHMEGDTYGIYEDYLYVSVDGFDFKIDR